MSQLIQLVNSKKLRNKDLETQRAVKCRRKCKTTPGIDRRIGKMARSNRRNSSKKILSALAAQGFEIHRRVNRRLCEVGLKTY